MDKIVRYKDLSPAAQEIAIRQVRNSIDYADHVLGALQCFANEALFVKLGLSLEPDVVDLVVSIRKHVTDLSKMKFSYCAADVIELVFSINTYMGKRTDEIINALRLNSNQVTDGVCFSNLGEFTVDYSNNNIKVYISPYDDVFEEGEEVNTRNWISDTIYGAISSIHADLFERIECLYSSQQIGAYIGARNPECYENGYILV